MVKKPVKKSSAVKKRTSSKKRKSAHKNNGGGFFRLFFKWAFVLGLWAAIILTGIVAWYATELPDITRSPNLERENAITVLARDDDVIARYGQLRGVSVEVNELPPYVAQAVIAVEDRRFYHHFGIDPIGIVRAMATNLYHGRLVQGGSTITQQLAKNLFLTPERTIKRKIQEAILSVWLEHELTKDEILSAYLNIVYLGSGAYGIEAASQTYYEKPATELTLYEAATIAGLLKAPSRYSPNSNPALAARRAQTVLNSMHEAGFISKEELEKQDMISKIRQTKPFGTQDKNGVRFFSDWVVSELDQIIGTPDNNVVVKTTIDPNIQKAAQDIIRKSIEDAADKDVTQGAAIVMDYSGAILAMVGGVDYQKSQFNRATQALRPPGSSFKPFVYLTAVENGYDLNDWVMDEEIKTGRYRPGNFQGRYYGEVPLYFAMMRSLNTVAVNLTRELGVGNVVHTARRLGVEAPLDANLSLALGSSGVPMIEMVTAYAVLANDGYPIKPHSIIEISSEDGEKIYIHQSIGQAYPVIDRNSAAQIRVMMELVVQEGTGQGAAGNYVAGGKTGTSQEFRDAWFIGFTDKYIAAVWVGNDDNSSMKRVTGGSVPAQIWRQIMNEAHRYGRFVSRGSGRPSGVNIIWSDTLDSHEGRMAGTSDNEYIPVNDNKDRRFVRVSGEEKYRNSPSNDNNENVQNTGEDADGFTVFQSVLERLSGGDGG